MHWYHAMASSPPNWLQLSSLSFSNYAVILNTIYGSLCFIITFILAPELDKIFLISCPIVSRRAVISFRQSYSESNHILGLFQFSAIQLFKWIHPNLLMGKTISAQRFGTHAKMYRYGTLPLLPHYKEALEFQPILHLPSSQISGSRKMTSAKPSVDHLPMNHYVLMVSQSS